MFARSERGSSSIPPTVRLSLLEQQFLLVAGVTLFLALNPFTKTCLRLWHIAFDLLLKDTIFKLCIFKLAGNSSEIVVVGAGFDSKHSTVGETATE